MPKPESEESIAERAKLRRQRSHEIAKITGSEKKGSSKQNKIQIADLMGVSKSNPTSDKKNQKQKQHVGYC